MALIPCPECNKKISDLAPSCPNCGFQLTPSTVEAAKKREQTAQKAVGIGCLLVLLLVFLGPCSCSGDKTGDGKKATSETGPTAIQAFTMSKQFVTDRLKAPSTAEYPWYEESFVTPLGKGRFKVSAYVDAQNSFGAQIRNRYTCILKSDDGDKWTLESIDIR